MKLPMFLTIGEIVTMFLHDEALKSQVRGHCFDDAPTDLLLSSSLLVKKGGVGKVASLPIEVSIHATLIQWRETTRIPMNLTIGAIVEIFLQDAVLRDRIFEISKKHRKVPKKRGKKQNELI